MKIGLISREYPEETGWGGIGAYTYELAHGLARLGHQVTVFSMAIRQERRYQEADGVTVWRLGGHYDLSKVPLVWRLNRLWHPHYLAVAKAVRSIEREGGLDIIESPSLLGQSALYQLSRGRTPVITRLHACAPIEIELNQRKWYPSLRIGHWLEKIAVRRSTAVTAPAAFITAENRPYLRLPKQVPVIPNPVDARLFKPLASASEDLGVLFVGRLDPRKGVQTLVRAMKIVWRSQPDLPLTLVGRDSTPAGLGSMRAWIEKELQELDKPKIQFIDWVPRAEMPALYNQAMLVAFPSLWEPFGYVCVEAMACQKPLLATRSGGPEEIVEHGKTGWLVPVDDPPALAAGILKMFKDPDLRAALAVRSRQAVLERFDTQVVVERMVAFYQDILASSC